MYCAHDIGFSAGGRALLDGASVEVLPGRVTVLIGPNGAGKSTLFKVLAGERRAQRGQVTLAGADLAGLKPARLARLRAVLPQSVHVAFAFTVEEVAGIGAKPGRDTAAPIRRALARVELAGLAGENYEHLSGGEKQRVQLARALVQLEGGEGPGYLLLDEPTASLDLAQQLLVLALVRELAGEGVGVLAVLHDLNLAAMVADEIVALKQGRVAARGTPGEVLTDARIAELYGVSARIGWAPATPFLLPQAASR
ncbi:heme ABC transporter ATP-binding protein [Ancylobacter dichloromethanicus]|uniref:Hemin import ATP-binding protein HmuV n=1 Tax=Ancylobacter dichloromethanicus TaxID=518825 RepID=A0A9W6JCL6_9HYPH|nr:heme ABC transporter ATP-binding protein [Ancylobacter dichloromethanicus]MBS7552086.1 heme ABC transporter ATP-binding protein [Ancylobacter dichloromethanicus]GLK73818.1 hemin import ATP-binding protein HmuV [Ancylobacter dichloromethanicus]